MKFPCNLQIDNSKPSSNSSIDDSLLQNGTLAIQVQKADTGSGVNYVDIYQMTGKTVTCNLCMHGYCCLFLNYTTDEGTIHPLVRKSRADLIVLPLESGSQYRFFTQATDNVGNQQPLDEAMENVMVANYLTSVGVCPNDCSNRGNCSELNTCICEAGFFGSDCSESMRVVILSYFLIICLI